MQFSAGNVISRAFSVTHKHFLTFFIIGLAVMGPITVIGYLLVQDAVSIEVSESAVGGIEMAKPKFDFARLAIAGLLVFIGNMMLAGALSFGAFQSLQGNRPTVGDCLRRAMARLVPITLASILTIVAIALGFVLLIVPGIIIACMLYVTVPVTTVERLGAIESMKRSMALTAGNRGAIFIMFLMVLILNWLVGKVQEVALSDAPALVVIGISMALSVYIGLVAGTLSAVCYHDLRVVKEGATTDDLVKVFG